MRRLEARIGSAWRGLWVKRETGRAFAIAGTVGTLALLILAHVFHEPWRDEVHCWIVGRHAAGLWDLLVGIRRYDGHPFLWYEVLHLASGIIPSVVGLHVVTIVLATASAYLWLARAPFPRLIRLMALGSYFLVFEYSVVCRSYVLGVFLLFAFCALYDRWAPRPVRLFSLLALLAATSVYGTMIAVSLALFLSLQAARSWWAGRGVATGDGTGRFRSWLVGLVIFSLGIAIVVASTLPPADEFFAPSWHTQLGSPQFIDALRRWWIAIFPVPANLGGWAVVPTGWGLNLPGFSAHVHWLAGATFLLFLAAMTETWPAAVAYASVVVLMSLFQETRNLGDVRHWGHFFVALLACLWLAHQAQPRSRLRSRFRFATHVLFGAVLLLQDGAGFFALRADFAHPFSGAEEAARFIEKAGLRDAAFVGSHDHLASAVMGILDRPFASGNNGEIGYSVVFHNRRHEVSVPETLRLARRFLAQNPARPVVLVMSWDLPAASVPSDLRLEKLMVTRPALHPEEMYRLYRLTAVH